MPAFFKHRLYPLFCLLVFAGIVAAFSQDNIVALYSTLRAQGWEETPCKVSRVGLREHRVSQRRSQRKMRDYSLNVRYEYTYEGRRYSSRRHDFWETTFDHDDAVQRMKALERHPAPTCYVNPDNPSEAVIDRSLNTLRALLMGAGVLVFVLAAASLARGKGGSREEIPRRRSDGRSARRYKG